MRQVQSGKLLRVHISESDRWQGKPLHEAIVAKCQELGIAGAIVYRGIEGYGHSARLHSVEVLASEDLPVVIEIVDSEEKIAGFALSWRVAKPIGPFKLTGRSPFPRSPGVLPDGPRRKLPCSPIFGRCGKVTATRFRLCSRA